MKLIFDLDLASISGGDISIIDGFFGDFVLVVANNHKNICIMSDTHDVTLDFDCIGGSIVSSTVLAGRP